MTAGYVLTPSGVIFVFEKKKKKKYINAIRCYS